MPPRHVLLTREQFSATVLARCGGRCCVPGCPAPAADPHHIIERRLWPDQGYYLANGAPLCEPHHLQAETTEISVQQLREWCGINDPIQPEQFEDDERIDKWGNPVLPDGRRLRGELWDDEAARKALKRGGMLDRFTNLVKFPKTFHAPWSPGVGKGDRRHASLDHMRGARIVGTVKMDGENTTLTREVMHARSIDGRHHPSRDWAKGFWGSVRWDIPEDWRVVCENLYALHSIAYSELLSYLYGLSLWDDRNVCLSWEDTIEWFALLGIVPVEAVYDGPFDAAAMQRVSEEVMARGEEGVVFRRAGAFTFREYARSTAKVVRLGHVQTDEHWMHGPVIPNGLATGDRRLQLAAARGLILEDR